MIERERKFTVHVNKLPELPDGRLIEAGYFTRDGIAVRVTRRSDGVCKVCFKGPGGMEREEVEFSIPAETAAELLTMAPTSIRKVRVDYEGWEIDFYERPDKLVVAEWEESPGKPPIPGPLPEWISEEVTGFPSLRNQELAWRYNLKA